MRRLLYDSHLKLAVVSAVYTVFLLLILPRIPINIDTSLVKIKSYVGGYQFNFLGKDFDFSTFKKSPEFGGGYKLIFTSPLSEAYGMRETIISRLRYLKITEYNLFSSTSGELRTFELYIPLVDNIEFVEDFLQQRYFLTFRQLLAGTEWDAENPAEYFYDLSRWEDAGINSTHILSAVVLQSASENVSQFQINLTPEGQEIFANVVAENVGKPIALYIDDSPFPISMPLIGEDLLGIQDINPVFTSNADVNSTRLLVEGVNSGFYSSEYEFINEGEMPAKYTGFSTRLFALSAILGFLLASLFTFITYRSFSLAFLLSLVVQFITFLFLLKVYSVYIGVKTVMVLFLSITLYLTFGSLLLSQMKEHKKDKSLIGVYTSEAFKSSMKIIKPYLFIALVAVFMFLIVRKIGDIALIRDLFFGFTSSYIAYATFKLFAGLFWVKRDK